MHKIPFSHLERGTFLVASPEIDQTIYARSVVLLCEHHTSGSFGLIINKPFDMQMPQELQHLAEIDNPNIQIRAGGPAQPNQIVLLHTPSEMAKDSLEVCPGVFLGGDVPFLQEAILNPSGPMINMYFGFCGWGQGELEREFLSGMWFLHPASPNPVFSQTPEKTWQLLLKEMGGKYATLSTIPEDLTLN